MLLWRVKYSRFANTSQAPRIWKTDSGSFLQTQHRSSVLTIPQYVFFVEFGNYCKFLSTADITLSVRILVALF